MDYVMAGTLCIMSVGIVITGYFCALVVLSLTLSRGRFYSFWQQLKAGFVERICSLLPIKFREIKACNETEGRKKERSSGRKTVSEPKKWTKKVEEEGSLSPSLVQLSVLTPLMLIPFWSCGGVVICVTLLPHIAFLKDRMTDVAQVCILWKGQLRQEAILLEMHLLSIVFCLPSLIVWFKGVTCGPFFALNPDPSLFSAVFMSLGLCVPFPHGLLSTRYVLLIPLVVYTHTLDNYIPGLSQCLAGSVGLYLNDSLRRYALEFEKKKVRESEMKKKQ